MKERRVPNGVSGSSFYPALWCFGLYYSKNGLKRVTMIRSLRNKHGQVWLVIAIFLPLMVVFSWFVVPGTVPVKTLLRPAMELMPVIKASGAKAGYCVNIRSNKEQTSWQLEWTNKLALTVPSAVIYWVESKDT